MREGLLYILSTYMYPEDKSGLGATSPSMRTLKSRMETPSPGYLVPEPAKTGFS